MKRSRHGDYVNGDITKTGDKSSIHCESCKRRLKDFNRVTHGKQHTNSYNCISNNSLEDAGYTTPKTDLYKQFKCMHFTGFCSFALLNFLSDSLSLKV